MKSEIQAKFDEVIKKGFHQVLKPLGFKKKNQNFYLQLSEITQIINVQKTIYSDKEQILFTINIGIFEPKFWSEFYNRYGSKAIPEFPTEPECLIRKRIGDLQKTGDIWYEINKSTDLEKLINENQQNITNYILPFFESLNSIEKIANQLEINSKLVHFPLAEMIFYAQQQQLAKAQQIYENLLKSANPMALSNIKSFGKRYGLKD